MHDIGSLIKQMRKAAGMSQMKLADKMGVSYQQVQKYEYGTSNLSVPRLMRLAEIFGVPVTALLDPKALEDTPPHHVAGSAVSPEEATLLQLFRRLGRVKVQRGIVAMMEDLVKLAEAGR